MRHTASFPSIIQVKKILKKFTKSVKSFIFPEKYLKSQEIAFISPRKTPWKVSKVMKTIIIENTQNHYWCAFETLSLGTGKYNILKELNKLKKKLLRGKARILGRSDYYLGNHD